MRGRNKRRGYGITAPGTYSSTPAWWSRELWRAGLLSDLQSEEVAELRAAVGTRGPVSVRAIYAVAIAISAAADGATGRNALPGNAALTSKTHSADGVDARALATVSVSSGYGLTTVQKAVQVLRRRGWLVLVRAGKNRLTSTERKELWGTGSKARQRRNVWACTMPEGRPPVDNSRHELASQNEGCDLPTTRRVVWVPPVGQNKNIRPIHDMRTGASRRAPTQTGRKRNDYRTDQRTARLAHDLRRRIPWLRNVPIRRLAPPLHRFAVTGWSASTLQTHLDRQLQRRGWSIPATPTAASAAALTDSDRQRTHAMRVPWGYLAFLLRHLDPSDLAVELAHKAELAARERYERQLIFGPPCPHGQPAGDLPSPTRGLLACPLCRRHRSLS